MAKKITTVFFCQECGHESSKWMGQCPACKQWNTFVEEKVSSTSSGTVKKGDIPKPTSISDISMHEDERMTTGIAELDRVLGGGIMNGSLTLVGGDPAITDVQAFIQ
jgi:DNA repair protein RadA/Sms